MADSVKTRMIPSKPIAKAPRASDVQAVGCDDENSHYNPLRGELLDGRYKVEEYLGKGTFGRVVACLDTVTGKEVAVKIIRAIPKYTRAGQIEVQILQQIKRNAHIPGRSSLATINESFVYKDHVCIVFPRYGSSVLDLLRFNKYQGFNLDWTRELSRTFLLGVQCMHKQGLIHTDLKPENILTMEPVVATRVRDRVFVHPPSADMVVIDVGSTISDHDRRPDLVCTRQYRPPEVILELQWNRAIDIWSCGCIIFEMFVGRTLFCTHNSAVHLAMMSKILGPMPEKMFNPQSQLAICYRAGGRWECPRDAPEEELRRYEACKPLRDEVLHSSRTLYDLLRRMLSWDPEKRPTITEVLLHPFFFEEQRETRTIQTDLSLMGSSSEMNAKTLMDENERLRKELNELKKRMRDLQAEKSRLTEWTQNPSRMYRGMGTDGQEDWR